MRIHLHTVSWNDMEMLPYFFRHYAPWVDQFFFFDDSSDDGTRAFLKAWNNVSVETTPRAPDGSWGSTSRAIHNSAWKRSIGKADWVIVTNLDEHLFHPKIKTYLEEMLSAGVTAVPAPGYQMVLEETPDAEAKLCRDYRLGVPEKLYSRMAVFRPDRIEETNYTVGRHRAKLTGDVVFPETDVIANLHYKHLGFANTLMRQRAQRERLAEADIANGWGRQYDWTNVELRAYFDQLHAASVDVTRIEQHDPRLCWWRANTSAGATLQSTFKRADE